MTPTFLVIGAPKCGTTTMWSLLRQHPGIFMPAKKELNFFTDHFDEGLPWYEKWFADAPTECRIGEASPSYTEFAPDEVVVDRIADHLPEARLIYMVRHPLRLIESLWLQWRTRSGRRVSHDFDRFVRQDEAALETARYFAHLSLFERRFPRDRIHVVFLEDFAEARDAVFADVCRFLDVEVAPPVAEAELNVSRRKTVDTHLASALRRTPGFSSLVAFLPSGVVEFARSLLKQRANARPQWRAATRSRVVEMLREDMGQFLARLGRQGIWNLEE